MYAVLRENTFRGDPVAVSARRAHLDQLQALHATQPGYEGSLAVDLGEGRCLLVNLWQSAEHARAALPSMIPAVQELVEPLLAKPSRLVGGGEVVTSNLVRANRESGRAPLR